VTPTGTWLAFCPADRQISLDDLHQRLSNEPDHSFRREPDRLVITVHDPSTGSSGEVFVEIESGPAVQRRATELADLDIVVDDAVPEPDRDLLRRSDLCYKISYDLEDPFTVYNTLMFVAGELMSECAATVFDETNERFV
jgi:hypothetical protein